MSGGNYLNTWTTTSGCWQNGDLQRIKLYPERGFQIAQDIPEDVWSAYEQLVHAGYDKFLIQEKELTKC
jgi:hypothetical protein